MKESTMTKSMSNMTPVGIIPDAVEQLRDHVSAVCDRDTTTAVSAYGQYEGTDLDSMKRLWIALSIKDVRLRHLDREVIIADHASGEHVMTADFLGADALEQADILINTFNKACERHSVHLDTTVEAFSLLSAETLATLPDLDATIVWSTDTLCHLHFSWTGINDALQKVTRHDKLKGFWTPYSADLVVRRVAAIAKAQRRLDLLATDGITIERPLLMKLQHHGIDLDGFVQRHLDWHAAWTPECGGLDPVRVDGESIQSAMLQGNVSGSFRLSDTVTWSKGSISVKGLASVPQTLRTAAGGMPVRTIVDHPWLDGYDFSGANTAVSKDGTPTTTIQTRRTARPVRIGDAKLPLAA